MESRITKYEGTREGVVCKTELCTAHAVGWGAQARRGTEVHKESDTRKKPWHRANRAYHLEVSKIVDADLQAPPEATPAHGCECSPPCRSVGTLTLLLHVQVPFHGVRADGLVLQGVFLHLLHQRFHLRPGSFKAVSCLP